MNASAVEPSTKDLIGASAKRLFEAHGFVGVSVRAIAADAGVDPSLVIRHFGSKEALFLEVLDFEGYVRPPLEGPIETLGVRLAEFICAREQLELRTRYTALLRASDREAVREGLRATERRMFLNDLVAVLPGPDKQARALLIGAQVGGIMQSAQAIEEEVLPVIGRERLVQLYGRAIQALVDVSD